MNQNFWGKGYTIIANKLKKTNRNPDEETTELQLQKQFPKKAKHHMRDNPFKDDVLIEVTSAELKVALDKTSRKKAPGPDAIRMELIKATA